MLESIKIVSPYIYLTEVQILNYFKRMQNFNNVNTLRYSAKRFYNFTVICLNEVGDNNLSFFELNFKRINY